MTTRIETTGERNKKVDREIEKILEGEEPHSEMPPEIPDEVEAGETLVHNSADREQVEKAEYRLERRERAEQTDMQWLLSDIRGRRILWRYLEETKYFAASFVQNDGLLQYLTGQRVIGKMIYLDIMNADSGAFAKMMQEFKGETNGKRKRKNSSGLDRNEG